MTGEVVPFPTKKVEEPPEPELGAVYCNNGARDAAVRYFIDWQFSPEGSERAADNLLISLWLQGYLIVPAE